MLVLLFGCSGTPEPEVPEPEPPRPARQPLANPHWDQVCRERRAPLVLNRPGEVLDTTAIAGELADFSSASALGDAHPFVEVAVSYDVWGAVRRVYVQARNVGEDDAEAVLRRLARRVRPRSRLLERIDLRVRATLSPSVELEVLPPIDCMPHVSHELMEPPRFLGEARVTAGKGCGRRSRSARCLAVRLHISPAAEVEEIEPLDGNTSLLDRVRESLVETRFDPAMINREPVRGTLDLVFRFPQ